MSAGVVDPQGCAECGIPERGHARQMGADGSHRWVRPSDEQILSRMKARRLARVVAREGALPMPAGPEPLPLSVEQEREIRSLDLLALMDDRVAPVISGHLAALLGEIDRLRVERRSTNEALDDAVQELRARRDVGPADTYLPALPWARLMDHEDLTEFLDELAASAITHASSETALAEVEETCGRWRLIAEAQHAHNTAPGPDAMTRTFAPTQVLGDGVLPETGGAE